MRSSRNAVTVSLLEDHGPTREALVQALGDFPDRVTVVSAAATAKGFFVSLAAQPVQVALVDLGLPDADGHEVIRLLGDKAPSIHAIALTAFDDGETVLEAIRAGAHGYLLKDEPMERLVSAIEEAAEGSHPISSRVAGFLITHARRAPPPTTLSDREEELAVCLAEGLTYAECSERMGIALGTVQDYVKRVYRKLDVNSKRAVRQWVSRYVTAR